MVFVSVSDDNAPYLVSVLLDICEIGDNKVNAGHIAVGKCHSAVNDESIVCTLKNSYILADIILNYSSLSSDFIEFLLELDFSSVELSSDFFLFELSLLSSLSELSSLPLKALSTDSLIQLAYAYAPVGTKCISSGSKYSG